MIDESPAELAYALTGKAYVVLFGKKACCRRGCITVIPSVENENVWLTGVRLCKE